MESPNGKVAEEKKSRLSRIEDGIKDQVCNCASSSSLSFSSRSPFLSFKRHLICINVLIIIILPPSPTFFRSLFRGEKEKVKQTALVLSEHYSQRSCMLCKFSLNLKSSSNSTFWPRFTLWPRLVLYITCPLANFLYSAS